MRLPPNLKYLLFFILVIGLIISGVLYLPQLIPGVSRILIVAIMGGMIILIFFTLFKPLLTFLYARADGMLSVYIDKSKTGIHVFSYHLNRNSRYGGFSTRDIQHYYIVLGTGKIFYQLIYSHTMKPLQGRSGWTGFESFEESVLKSQGFNISLATISKKAGMPLELGQRIEITGENYFSFEIDNMIVEAKKYDTATDEGLIVSSADKATNKIIWRQKI